MFLDQREDGRFVELWVDQQLMGSFRPAGLQRFLEVIFDNQISLDYVEGRNHHYRRISTQ